MDISPIAYARNGFHSKFGIPRQSREDSVLETRIVFLPAYRDANALRGMEGYSHLWLLWGFSEVSGVRETKMDASWSPTVRPPRLGGNQRMGVFATRSPFRPNPIGLTSVRLLRMEQTAEEGTVLVVSGADVLDGTPIYDIKPYLPFSDAHPEARGGFADEQKDYRLPVLWDEQAIHCSLPSGRRAELEEILSQDPRPAYQSDAERVYRFEYADYAVAFSVTDAGVRVLEVK